MSYLPAPTPRPHWRHFALNIVSPAILTFVLFFGLIFAVILPTMRKNIVERKKEMIRELTQAAWSELASLHAQEQRGALTREAAQQAAVARIQAMRYGDEGKDYFWISDQAPRMIMHPYRPDLNGQDLTGYSDPAGKKLFVEFTQVVRAQGDGYVDYLWQWKDDEKRVVPKLSYVKGFPPWGWIVGTGIYLEDVRAEISQMIQRVLQVSLGFSVIVATLLAYIARQGHRLERDRWQAETALRQSEEKYRLLVESASEGVLLVLQDRPVYANRTLLGRLGYTEQELTELTLEALVETVPTGSASEKRARLRAKNGEAADVLLAITPVTIGEKPGQMWSIKDASARRKTEETLARLLADLQSMLPLATRSLKNSSVTLLTCALDTPIHQAAAAMARAKTSAILVQGPSGEPIGIVTDHDLRNRVLAAAKNPAQPVSAIMTAPLVRIADRALLFEAARVMQEQHVQHLVVTDEQGATRGVLTGTEILHAQRHAIGALLGEIQEAKTPEELKDCRSKLPVFIKALLESGARVESITRIMTTVSDAILGRLIALAEAELGPPPARYAFVALGSEAREEQTLATDQDNAIIFADVPPERSEAVQAYFLQLGEKVCGWLDLIGYRRCRGEVMACNRKWCQPLARWREYFAECVTAARPQDLLDVNVFFDFRCAHGESDHVARLREHLHGLLEGEGKNTFFFHLAQSTLQFRPPRGFFGNIQLEAAGEHAAAFNIKAAIIPLVNFARIYALQNRLPETNTLERLHRLRDRELLLPSSHDELVQAYTALMQMRLTHQAAQWHRGVPPDNHLDLEELTQLERSVLKKVFADITVFQARMQTDFARTA
ncbi:MAG: cache domain-containing protein [Opitutae bacterium]|nr:cache domain-containing protein [Opitutae bacterium]